MNCPFCNDDSPESIYNLQDYITKDNFNLLRCQRCGLVFTSPILDKDDILHYYPSFYHGRQVSRPSYFIDRLNSLFISLRVRKIEHFKIRGRILDIGCGKTTFLSAMQKSGWEVVGTELPIFENKSKQFQIFYQDISKCNFLPEMFDVVVIWHVLEHLPNPFKTLAEVHRILKNDGILVISLPNFGSWQTKIFKSKWFGLDVPRHYYHFTEDFLIGMLKKYKFSIFKKSNFSLQQSVFSVLESMFNCLGCEFNFLFSYILEDKKISCKENWFDIIITLSLIVFLLPLAMFFAIFESCFKKGGIIEIYARKI